MGRARIIVSFPPGDVIVDGDENIIYRVILTERRFKRRKDTNILLLKEAGDRLQRYQNGESIRFDLPVEKKGTEFQNDVWNAVKKIPYGEVRTYKDIANDCGYPGAYRAVGNALSMNPFPILIPCHRVIRADGSIGGFTGGLIWKRFLLRLEDENKDR